MAERLQRSGLGTLLFDLLQTEEASNRRNVFDIGLLAERLALATDWVRLCGARHVNDESQPALVMRTACRVRSMTWAVQNRPRWASRRLSQLT